MAIETSEVIAERVLDSIESVYARLRQFPKSGTACDDLAPGLRSTVRGPYLIFHRVEAHAVIVTRILHAARDAAAFAAQGDLS